MPYLTFQLQADSDYLRIYEGNSTDSNLLAELTGFEIPANVTRCRGNQMHVVFSSNSGWTYSGFKANIHVSEYGCTSSCPCGVDEGHCESNNQCLSGLACGYDNCKAELGYLNGRNCCYNTTAYCSEFLSGENGNWTIQTPFDNPNEVVKEVECQWYIDGSTNTHFIKSGNGSATCGADVSDWSCCTSSRPCTLGEGDCDYDIDCFNRLTCGTDNCGPSFPTGFDCCDFPSVTTANDFVMTMALQTFEVSILQYDRFFCTLLSALMINTFRWHQVLCSYMRAAALTLL